VLIPVTAFLLSIGGTGLSGGNQAKKSTHATDFLIFGTVFTDRGLSLPGAEIRVHRADEKKVRWEARSDRRGEFAVRVPRSAEYELAVRLKGWQDEARRIDAKAGDREDLVIRMQPAAGGKTK
jgi:hypothetical protein